MDPPDGEAGSSEGPSRAAAASPFQVQLPAQSASLAAPLGCSVSAWQPGTCCSAQCWCGTQGWSGPAPDSPEHRQHDSPRGSSDAAHSPVTSQALVHDQVLHPACGCACATVLWGLDSLSARLPQVAGPSNSQPLSLPDVSGMPTLPDMLEHLQVQPPACCTTVLIVAQIGT